MAILPACTQAGKIASGTTMGSLQQFLSRKKWEGYTGGVSKKYLLGGGNKNGMKGAGFKIYYQQCQLKFHQVVKYPH